MGTHPRLHLTRNPSSHENRNPVQTFKYTVHGRQERNFLRFDLQPSLLAHLARGARLKRLARLETTAWERVCS